MPDTIAHYRLGSKLGEGGMGVVYAAADERLHRQVAIKMLRPAGRDPRSRERLWREARAAASVSHPNVCQLYEVGEADGELFIAMELLDGESVAARLARGPVPLAASADITRAILSALSAIHARGIVHRDLKPSNVMIDERERARLIDFGIAKLTADGEATLTSTHATLGTPIYMAPEQLDGSASADHRADLYAAGTMLFRLVSGKLPFENTNPTQVLVLKRQFDAPTLSERTNASWPEPLESFLARLLALRADDRPNDTAQVLADLRALRRDLGAFVPGPPSSGDDGPSSEMETPVMSRRRR
jgi:serine/threonine protein kinase